MNLCVFEGCTHKAHCKGLCYGHYGQQHSGKPLTPLKARKKFAAPAPGLRICTNCERVLNADQDFYKNTNGTPMATCKKCLREKQYLYRRRKEAGTG